MGCCDKIPTRYVIMLMIFVTTYVNYVTKSNMSISLPAMVSPGNKTFIAECKRLDSGPTSGNTSNAAKPEEDTGPKYNWDENVQGLVLAAYFYGFLISSAPAGMIAEWVGPYWTILASTALCAVLNSACVWLIPLHWGALFGCRLFIGICGGVVYPALQCLIGRWAPPQERTKFVACLSGNTLGTCLTWMLGGVVIRHYQWPWGFHVMTCQLVIFCCVFAFLTSDSPVEHKWATDDEISYIEEAQEGSVSSIKTVPPFKAIFTSVPFWTFCLLQFGSWWGLYLQMTAVPKFMKEYVGFDIQSSGILASLPQLARVILAILYGIIGDCLKKKFKRAVILKTFILFSHIIPGTLLALVPLAKCNAAAAIALLTLTLGINGAVVVTNLANPTDLSPNFAGTIFGIASCFAGSTGFIVPSITGAVLTAFGNNLTAWGSVFALGGTVYLASGIVFLIFGSAEIQPWNEK